MGRIFFRNDQMDEMAAFVTALNYNGQRFTSEVEVHGFYIIIY